MTVGDLKFTLRNASVLKVKNLKGEEFDEFDYMLSEVEEITTELKTVVFENQARVEAYIVAIVE